MILLLVGMVIVGFVILGLYSLKRYLGLVLLFVFVGANQFVQNLLAATVYVEVLDRYPVSPGSAVLFSAGLFAVLLVYVRESIPKARQLIYSVLLANGVLALIATSTQWGLRTERLVSVVPNADWLPDYTIGTFAIGTLLLIVDVFLVIVVYELLTGRLHWLGRWAHLVLSLSIVLAFDSLFFSAVAFRGQQGIQDLVVGNVGGKLVAAVIYGSMLWAYLRHTEGATGAGEVSFRDPLSIFTYRERYRQLKAEKVELEKTHEEEIRRAAIALEGAGLGLWDWQIPTGEAFYDQTWLEMLGYDGEDSNGRAEFWRSKIHPDDDGKVQKSQEEHLAGQTPMYNVEHRLKTRSGAWKWVQSLGQVIERDSRGKPIRMSGAHLDIDDRKNAEQRLELTERHYRELFDHAPLMYVTTGDTEGIPFIKSCNSAFLETLGYEQHEVIGRPLGDFYSDESRRALLGRDGYRESLAGRAVSRERELLTKEGVPVSALLRAQPEVDVDGRVVGTRAMFVDISERKRAEEALKESESRLEEAQRMAHVGSFRVNQKSGELFWTDEVYEIFGREKETFTPTMEAFFASVFPDDVDLITVPQEAADQGIRNYELDHRIVRPSGETRFVHSRVRLEVGSDGNVLNVLGTIQDVTELRRTERTLARSRGQLRKLAARLEAAREDERESIAREIHDEMGQALTGIRMDASALRPALSSDAVSERFEAMMELIDSTIEKSRDLSSRLRPPVLDDLGLTDAIEWQVNEFSSRSGIACQLDLSAECSDLDSRTNLTIFRILQEALTNVVRHAEARHVKVSLRRDADAVLLRVEDDGVGIEPGALGAGGSLGLLGMRERAEGIGGRLSVGRVGERGTVVALTVEP